MAKRISIGIAVVVGGLLCLVGWAWWTEPARLTTPSVRTGLARTLDGDVLFSSADPTAAITLDPSLDYVGGQRFTLYGTAEVEQHVFARSSPDGRTRSVLVVHFEAVRPEVDWTYDYTGSAFRTALGDLTFFSDTEPGRVSGPLPLGKPGTDSYRAKKLAAEAGHDVPRDFVWSRSVYVTNDGRSELMILFMDEMPSGLTREALLPGGERAAEWPALSDAHLEELARLVSVEARS